MSSLNTYWLCRAPGSPSEGPYTIGQLRKMHEAGTVTAESLICRKGEEGEWMSLDDEIEAVTLENPVGMSRPERVLAARQSRKVKTSGSGCAAVSLFLLGLVVGLISLVMFWPLAILGILLIIAAFMVDAKYARISFCGSCGNDVAGTSLRCPTCQAELR